MHLLGVELNKERTRSTRTWPRAHLLWFL